MQQTNRSRHRHITSFQVISLGFLSVILLGSLLLMLPIATKSGQCTFFLDALFTATSAVCVTGLVINDTATYWSLAGQFDSNVRDLEGALKDISLVANVRQLDTITVEVAAEAIRARKMDSPKLTLIPIEDIQTEVGKFYNVTVKEIKATKRTQNIVLARQVAMYLAREMTDNSLPKIGKEFGGRDHSTVLHAYNKIKNMIAQDDSLRIEIDTIKNKIK